MDPCAQYRAYPVYENCEDGFNDRDVPVFRAGIESDPELNFTRVMAELDGGAWTYGDYTLIVDESSFLQRPQAMHEDLARLIRQAPDDITVIQTLHRPSETHTTVRALASDVFFFQMYLSRDLDVVTESYGSHVAEAVRHLGPHEVLHWWLGPAGQPQSCIWREPASWNVPIGGVMSDGNETTAADDQAESSADDQESSETDDQANDQAEENAPAPVKAAAEHDEVDDVRKQLKAAKNELSRVRGENEKLHRQLRAQKKPTEVVKPAATAPVEPPPQKEQSILEWLLG